jgi:glycyl-tRNA synthetase beta chain
MQRVQAIAQVIATHVGLSDSEKEQLKEASEIYKFDLVTLMVDEFPELQGVIGEKYALLQGKTPEVALAIREHYLPKSSEGALPESNVGAVLAIADKLDTLMTFFSVGLTPKGSNDPYALRRQAYGIIRIIENKDWHFPVGVLHQEIEKLINENETLFGLHLEETKGAIDTFLKARMKQWFNGKDIRHDIIEAVVESEQTDLNNMFEIAEILRSSAKTLDFKPTVESLTRVINLAQKLDVTNKENSKTLTLSENFEALKSLNPLIENYFENTMVMVEDVAVRNNRLKQLSEIATMALSFASLDKLIVK